MLSDHIILNREIKHKLLSNNYINVDQCVDNRVRVFWPEIIIISCEYNLNVLKYFTIKIGGVVIWKIPLSLIFKIFPPRLIDSKYLIDLPKSFFLNEYHRFQNGENKFLKFEPMTMYGNLNYLTDIHINEFNVNYFSGIPKISLFFHQVCIELSSNESIHYDLKFETFCLKNYNNNYSNQLTLCATGLKVNLIHEIFFDVENVKFLDSQCCRTMSLFFETLSSSDLSDLYFIIKIITSSYKFISNQKIIPVGKKLKSIREKILEQNTNLLKPLCEITAGYMDVLYSNVFLKYNCKKTLHFFLYLPNTLRFLSGMAGLYYDVCY